MVFIKRGRKSEDIYHTFRVHQDEKNNKLRELINYPVDLTNI